MMESPGKILKKEREMRNISLEKIYSFTKIKEHHLEAIEEDRYELLPHTLYVKGYLKSYAKYLALDEKDILLQYENYLKSLLPPEPPGLLPEVSPPKKSIRPFLPFSLTIATLLLASLFIAYLIHDPTEEKPTASILFPVLPATAIQREEERQTNDVVQPKGIQELENKEVEAHLTPAFEILEADMGTGIEKENDQQFLTGNSSEFTSNNQRGYFFTRIRTPRLGKIAHVWLLEGKEYHRIEMDVKPPAWSVYSYLTFRPQHTGNWKAEAREGDQILTSLNFKVFE
jgi:cytoskeletal protein RodZ